MPMTYVNLDDTPRAPLMLSDTAMVLLRQYIALNDHRDAIRDILTPYDSRVSEEAKQRWIAWLEGHDDQAETQMETELLQEIWLLWRSQDLPLIRHLDWHLILEGDFIMWAEKSRILEQNNGVGQGRSNWETSSMLVRFFIKLSEAYTKAFAAHIQTKTTP
jgi:hypothetical protein